MKLNRKGTHILSFIFLSLILVLSFSADLVLGSVYIPFKHLLSAFFTINDDPQYQVIIYEFRLPRAITGLFAGAALALSGLQMQTLFRNPLAGPYILGISSGASLGVAVLVMGFSSFFVGQAQGIISSWSLVLAAVLGAGSVMFVIMLISARVRDIMTLLILGILFASATSAIVNVMQYFSHANLLKAFIVWSFGSLSNVTSSQLYVLMTGIIFGMILSVFSFKLLNALLLGEEYARSIGLPVQFARYLIFLSTSILAGTVTAFCGPIGFIGIAAPHITRIIFRSSDHKLVIPGSILTGSILLILSDILAQLPGSEQILPINSVTALIGIPVVIWLVIKNQKVISIS